LHCCLALLLWCRLALLLLLWRCLMLLRNRLTLLRSRLMLLLRCRLAWLLLWRCLMLLRDRLTFLRSCLVLLLWFRLTLLRSRLALLLLWRCLMLLLLWCRLVLLLLLHSPIGSLQRGRCFHVAIGRERLADCHIGRAAMICAGKLGLVGAGGTLILHLGCHRRRVRLMHCRQFRRPRRRMDPP
jgi:hypothetical protein